MAPENLDDFKEALKNTAIRAQKGSKGHNSELVNALRSPQSAEMARNMVRHSRAMSVSSL